ncbi:MAG: helix-turn-helix transcriptional regulator [Oscillibacter sp.]|nr:helix-turn-helix transcriptional regulator [Oscillibacter sp.]
MFSKELFAQRVREVRKLHGETQKALGDCIGMKANNVSEMESGIKATTSEKIARICRHYHVSADYLLGLSDDPQGGCERWTEEEE